MKTALTFQPRNLAFKAMETWLLAAAFVLGNLALPQLCHLLPNGGMMFLPIYFFTLIAAYKYGIRTGLLTAVLSPVLNSLLFGMPVVAMLPIILIKSSLLAIAAALVASRSRKVALWLLALVVLSYQLVGGLAEWGLTGSLTAALQDFRLGSPGMLLQVFGGWLILRRMASL